MSRITLAVLVVGAALVLVLAGGSVHGQTRYLWVNTTEDLALNAGQCLPQQPCTLRKAIELAEGRQSIVTACFDPEVVPGAMPCPAGALPLSGEDPNFDAATGRWTLTVGSGNVSAGSPNRSRIAIRAVLSRMILSSVLKVKDTTQASFPYSATEA